MKKLLALLFGLTVFPGIVQAQIKMINNANLDSISTEKLIFIDVSTSWCAPCRWMEQNVFTDSIVSSYMNKNFLSFKYDAEKGYGKTINKKYNVSGYPTYIFLKQNKEVLLIRSGSSTTAEFLTMAKMALAESSGRKTIHDWELEFQQNKSDTALLKKYIFQRINMGMSTVGYIGHYLNLLENDDIAKIENQTLLFYSDITLDSKWYNYLINKQKNYVSYHDVRILDMFDPKVKILAVLNKSAGEVTRENVNEFVQKAEKTIRQMNENKLDYLLEYLPVKIKAFNQVVKNKETLSALKEFETLVFNLDRETFESENLKKKELFLNYYRKKGQLDSLMHTGQFKTRLGIVSKAFNFKLDGSFARIKENNFVEDTVTINQLINRIEQQLTKLVN